MTDTDREYEYKVITFEPAHAATINVNETYPCRAADGLTSTEAASLACEECLDGPEWPGIVPAHWEPGAWLTAYSTAYAEAWARKVAEDAEPEN